MGQASRVSRGPSGPEALREDAGEHSLAPALADLPGGFGECFSEMLAAQRPPSGWNQRLPVEEGPGFGHTEACYNLYGLEGWPFFVETQKAI